jgi:hypothetical protein
VLKEQKTLFDSVFGLGIALGLAVKASQIMADEAIGSFYGMGKGFGG